jgi:purine-nucleoside phosphorylase
MGSFAEFKRIPKLHDFQPEWGLVLGSGFGEVVRRVTDPVSVTYTAIGLPDSRVPGHAGKFVAGMLGGKRVLIAQGRVHLYEGREPSEVSACVRFMAETGISKLILTNAAGTLNRAHPPGTMMMLEDHINLTGTSPLMGLSGPPQFADMTEVYSKKLQANFLHVATKENFTLHKGVYAGVHGPQYETPAEIRMLKSFGADAVGMSTVLEAIQARAKGIETAGFSCLTNWAAGFNESPLNHTEVLECVKMVTEEFGGFIEKALAEF